MAWTGPGTADEVTVPDIVGLLVTDARKVAWEAGLVADSWSRSFF
ncbi:hypothetical protein GCM10009760_56370 [Kitasatospora kazusensis]|uniref:FXSXX-COOH protein n=1 Tax=Kitasatospora kazusensis TaxID=407974 RepID=A0ABP5M2N2_9ACTN